jgi:signal transduction histidine kinase
MWPGLIEKTPEETIDIKRKLKNIIELLDGSNQSIRRILSELRPRILDDYGLLEAIEWLGRQFTEATGIPVKFITPEKDIKVSEQIATCIFRVSQEALTNITRYAHAKNVSISIKIIEENIILTIEDNGIGFDTAAVQNKKSFGILGMKERVHSLGGKFELISSSGKGTKITVSLPYKV